MATATQRGYDPAAMAWTEIDVQQAAATGNGPTNIEDEGLFQLVALRRKAAQRKVMPKPAAGNPDGLASNGRARTVQPKSKLIKWRPRDIPKMSADDIIVVLKPRETLHLKTAFQTGDLGAAIAQYVGGEAAATLNVWPVWTQNLIVFGTQHVEAANKLARDWNLNMGSGSVPLRGHVKLNGEVCRGVITVRADERTASLKGKVVWREGELAFVRKLGTSNVAVLTFVGRRVPRYVHYNCECTVVRKYKKTVPACYRCGTIGHWIDNCPHPDVARCGYWGQKVGASEQGLAEHECAPLCMVCGEAHLTGSANCKGKFRRLQRPGNQQGAPRNKTSKASGNGGSSLGKSGQATGISPENKTSKKNKNRNASGQSVKTPLSQEGDFSPLDTSNAAITSKVSTWAGVASSSPSPLELELKKEVALLRTKNEQLERKVIALQNVRAEPPLPGTLDSGDESASLCSGMGPVTYGPLINYLESRMTALEKSVADQMAPLPTMIAQIIQAQMQQLVTTLTQQITAAVTQNVKCWIQASPKLFRRAGPVKEVGRPSKVCRNIDEDAIEDVRLIPTPQRKPSPDTEQLGTPSIFDRGGAEHFRLPCTANIPTAMQIDQACPINDCLPIYNELLFDIGMELREQHEGSLSLVSYQPFEAGVISPPETDLHRANAFLRWLLRTHVCIAGLELKYKWATAHIQVVLEELPENSRLKKLRVEFPYGDSLQTEFATLFPRLRCLEELHCYMSPSTDALLAALSAHLRTTTCLTSLVFHACFEDGQPPKTFVDALAANSTLKSLELWANWMTREQPGRLGEYLRNNGLLTHLTIFGEAMDREGLLLDESLVRNCTLSTLHICRVCGGERTAEFLTKILAGCAKLKKLSLGGVRDEYIDLPETTLTRCAEALAENQALEELTVQYSLWHPNNWIVFFELLPKNEHLKKLEVSNHGPKDYETLLSVLEALTQTKSWRRVSFGSYMHGTVAVDLMHVRSFSSIHIYGEVNVKIHALQRLPAFDHFTCISIVIFEPDERLFFSLGKYILATSALKELHLLVTNAAEASGSEWNPIDFVLPLSEAMGGNYNLLEVQLHSTAKVGADARRCLFRIRETTRRNSRLLERAAAFKQITPLDWHTANALEKVSQHPALVRELAEKEGIAAHEVARMVKSLLRSVDGLHDFMRLTGVVKKRVVCAPSVDSCGMQLHDLNTYCWRVVRQYLSFDDVKRFTVAVPENTTPSCPRRS
ncbi:hypothetical protein HPB52_001394 [Rhipicephalus sanguineus]|uniref:CCHC-type domain-containing protein n=1 Tax=Rhipicephalus sanguineus TaxID=34632 RepID=A0A9D4T6M2_RHISA|nr:hypothetical protein HPB52_001394 [Rhipicephalus sanguineus]